MRHFPNEFLIQMAQDYKLTRGQQEAFLAKFGETGKNKSNEEVAQGLSITVSTLSTRMTGVYDKLLITAGGPTKFNLLCNFLEQKFQQYQKLRQSNSNQAEISGDQRLPEPPQTEPVVQRVRQQVFSDINQRCGTMRVLDKEQPITIDSIYISVNILDKLTSNLRPSINELRESRDIEVFDRSTLGRGQHKRIPGIEAVKQHEKLLVLGKPGSGKTTFLKWLALLCNAGQLHQHRVPIFVTLKEFAEDPKQRSLINFIAQEWTKSEIKDAHAAVQHILKEGRSLILLDGLDEVRAEDHDHVLQTIEQTTRQFSKNQFVMTCRIAAKEYTLNHFTEVEVADFDQKQIVEFTQKWFHEAPTKAAKFLEALKEQSSLQELATNPLLLTLLCLVFEAKTTFLKSRADLIEEGLHLLLKKWDRKRQIKRDEVYKELSLNCKKDLLGQVASTMFERGEYYLKQRFVEEEIENYIQNLPNATNLEALELDSEEVLKSIEAQHGLLVERAQGIYSFSHLIFQEYFTAYQIKKLGDFGKLVCHITEERWREIFLLTVEMMQDAGQLVQMMKQKIDRILAQDEKLQQFLSWVKQKSDSVKAPYKPAAIRAFYLRLDHNLDPGFNRALALARPFDLDRALALAPALDLALARNLDRNLARNLEPARNLDLSLRLLVVRDCNLELALNVTRPFALDFDLELALDRALTRALTRARARYLDGNLAVYRALCFDLFLARDLAPDSGLQRKLQQLIDQLPQHPSTGNWEGYTKWWNENRQAWTERLRKTMIQYRKFRHDWQFTESQQELLKHYYTANNLLVECLNSDCNVSGKVREEIEATLLLPLRSSSPGCLTEVEESQ
ncbi:NACHT domain-containing NTPase [Phormidium tenue FACHB-886]|nr:NACHT domain-containing NTPase [Phormidium tenue FACHB-886]